MILMNMDYESSANCISGKIFLIAHSIWLNTHKSKLTNMRNLIECDYSSISISRRKAYTITKMPK